MKKACCIYRIDDVTPGMNWDNFHKFLNLFQKYNVVPLLGVVPENRDPNLTLGKEDGSFWKTIKRLSDSGRVEISQHGYRHIYTTNGIQLFYRICGFQPQSEFSGISYEKQYRMIKAGRDILRRHGIKADIWMAPGHSFDKNTVRALKELKFRAVTDGIGLFPVKKEGITFVPQQVWGPVKSRIGVKTICLHLNTADDEMYRMVEEHLKSCDCIVPFSSVLNYEASAYHSLLNHMYKLVFIVRLLKREVRRLVDIR